MATDLPASRNLWVKICANTCVEDALAAAELGADAVGFVFAHSKRQVNAAQVRAIVEQLPSGVERVGVFGQLPAEEIASTAEAARLTAIQLHGGFDAHLTARLLDLVPEMALIQTAHWVVEPDHASAEHVTTALDRMERFAAGRRVLVDAKVGSASGGMGVAFDWREAGKVLRRPGGPKVILAGGLRPDNVAEAIRLVRPWGVDVASGVEAAPGRKDVAKLQAFITNARDAARESAADEEL